MRDLRLMAATAVAPTLWGTTYVVTTQALPEHRPLLAAAARALPAGLLLLGVVALTGNRAGNGAGNSAGSRTGNRRVLPTGDWWWRAALLGTVNIALFFSLLFVAAYRLPGGIAAVLGAIGPFLVAAFAVPLLGERPDRRTLIAAAIGVAGVSVLVLRSAVALDPIGIAASAAGVVAFALSTVLGRRWGAPPGYPSRITAVLALTGWQLTVGGALLVGATLVVEGGIPALSVGNVAGFGYLSLVGTAVAYVLWFRGVTSLAPTRVTVLSLLSPVVAAVLGWVALGQSLSGAQLAGAGAVLGAVGLGATATPKRREARICPSPGHATATIPARLCGCPTATRTGTPRERRITTPPPPPAIIADPQPRVGSWSNRGFDRGIHPVGTGRRPRLGPRPHPQHDGAARGGG